MAEEQAPLASPDKAAARPSEEHEPPQAEDVPPDTGEAPSAQATAEAATEDPGAADAAAHIKLDAAGIARVKHLGRYVFVRRLVTLCSVFMSALLQAFVIQAFINPAGLLSSGFTDRKSVV